MAASVFHSGSFGTVAVNGVELPIVNWEVRPTVELSEFRNSRSGGYVLREATFQDCQVRIDVDFDFGNNPFSTPMSIAAGASLSSVKLCLHQSASGALDGPGWSFPTLIVEGTPQQLAVDGKIATRLTCRSNGSFTGPG